MFDLSIDRRVARLTLARPEARNALTLQGWSELAELLGEVEQAEGRLLILAGSGSAFSAGADLLDFERMHGDPAACAAFRAGIRRGLDRLRTLPIPTVALVDGPCYGAGVAVAMACDLRLAGPGALFAITPAKIGISYPQQDIHALVALVGPGQAARLLFTGAPIGGDEALRIGLADMHADALDGLVEAILANDASSLATLKRGLRLAAQGQRTDSAQDVEFDRLIGSDALAERLAERRKP